MKIRLTRNPTLLTALLSVAAIGGYLAYRLTLGVSDEGADVARTVAGQPDPSAAAPAPLDGLPEVMLADIDGNPTPLSTYAGKPLLINFWATWCAPCLREIPLLNEFGADNESIQVIGIAVDYADKVQQYATETMTFGYPVLVGQSEGMNAMATFRNDAGVMPFSVFTAADGAVLGTHAGELHTEHLDNLAATIAALEAGTIDRATAREQLAGLR